MVKMVIAILLITLFGCCCNRRRNMEAGRYIKVDSIQFAFSLTVINLASSGVKIINVTTK